MVYLDELFKNNQIIACQRMVTYLTSYPRCILMDANIYIYTQLFTADKLDRWIYRQINRQIERQLFRQIDRQLVVLKLDAGCPNKHDDLVTNSISSLFKAGLFQLDNKCKSYLSFKIYRICLAIKGLKLFYFLFELIKQNSILMELNVNVSG